jgi:hypothetical protein
MSAPGPLAPNSATRPADSSLIEHPVHDTAKTSFADSDVPKIALRINCMAGALPTLDNVPANMRITGLKRRIHETCPDMPAHTQRLVVMQNPAPSVSGADDDEDGSGPLHVVLGDNDSLDSFACVSDGCTIEVLMTEGRVTFGAAAFAAAVLDYLCAELVELGGNAARDNQKNNIGAREIRLAISFDLELDQLFNRLAMCHRRILPFMFPEFDAEYADNIHILEDAESVDHYKYAHWGVDEADREHEPEEEQPAEELTLDDEDTGDDLESQLSADDADLFMDAHVRPLMLRRGVVTNFEHSYHASIFKILHQMHPYGLGFTKQGMESMNLIMNLTLNAIASFAFYCAAEGCERTLTPIAMQDAVRAIFPGELAIHAKNMGNTAVMRLDSAMRQRRNNRTFQECTDIEIPLFHRHLNAAFATGFAPQPATRPWTRPPSESSFNISIHPKYNIDPSCDHAFSLEVTGDDLVGSVINRAQGMLHLSPSQGYVLVYITKASDDSGNVIQTVLDADRALRSYGIDAQVDASCLDLSDKSTINREWSRPSLWLCTDEFSLQVGFALHFAYQLACFIYF